MAFAASLTLHDEFYILMPAKVSGSAYKIVKDRAYHHGTMLISTRLDTLGELLRSGKVRATGYPRYAVPLH